MAVKVKCPACFHEMSLKSVKAGRFKPSCIACKEPFLLVVSDTDPPQLKVTRIAPASATRVDSTAPAHSPAQSIESTLKASATAPSNQETFDQVPDPMSGKTAGLDSNAATLDQALSSQPRSRSFSVDPDATLDADSSNKQTTASSNLAPLAKLPANDDKPTLASRNQPATDRGRAPATTPDTHPRATVRDEIPMPERLGGYRILKVLGRGGMGSVYLAKQLSLDRQVAVKTIQSEWSANPRVIARFIREAYAAAQLTHHNVVQIYDLGQDHNLNFFSMELVEGGSLDELLKQHGRIAPKEAATYILHAARGLMFAHEHGMIHRDIKPANLMLTKDALVKVADLGLVKTPSLAEDELTQTDEDKNQMLASARTQVTGAGSTLGTPAYMSPEQAEDAHNVDQRADIYSLGCTFYALLVGKPPFGSMSAIEILSKIKTEPIARPDKVVSGIPAELASIVERMTAKQRDDRYPSLEQVITELEQYLASTNSANVDLAKQRADTLRNAADQFQQVAAVRLRKLLPMLFAGICLIGLLLGLFISVRFAVMCALMLVTTPILCTLISSFTGGRSPITRRLRTVVLSSSIGDWITWTLASLLLLIAFWISGMMGYAIVALVLSAGAAAAYSGLVTRPLVKQRQAAVEAANEALREMRLAGMDEMAIGQFMAEFSGRDWEELFEVIFDYELMRQMRSTLQATGKLRGKNRFQRWRDLIVDRLDNRCKTIRDERERSILAKVEAVSLQASGVGKREAEQRAAELANSLVAVASETRAMAVHSVPGSNTGPVDAAAKRERIKLMLASARSGKPKSLTAEASRATGAFISHLLGGKLRFAVGALLIAGCLMWAHQNNLFDKTKLSEVTKTVANSASALTEGNKSLEAGQAAGMEVTQKVGQLLSNTKPLSFPVIGGLYTSFAPGIMGLIITLSALAGSWRLTFPALGAAAITLLGPSLGIPSLGLSQGAAWLSCGIGLTLLSVPLFVKSLR
jgi:eukaryotic-like serine/threonine-protein kinase